MASVFNFVHGSIFAPKLKAVCFMLLTCLACMASKGAAAQDHQRLVAYFPQWGIYSNPPYFVQDLTRNSGAEMIDQLDYAQGAVSNGRCSLADAKADLEYVFPAKASVSGVADNPRSKFRGNFHQLSELKHRYPQLKILISLEGSADYFAYDALPEHRAAFVSSCIDTFLQGNFAPGVSEPGIFDGFDLDWEYPKDADAANYVAALQEFRKQMDVFKPGLLLTVAVGPSPHMYPGVDMTAVGKSVDVVGVMNYDYAGPWSETTGMIAPLYKDKADPRDGGSVAGSLSQYMAAGIRPEKLLMGLPFYGYGWQHVSVVNNGLFQPGHAIHGDQPYSYVAGLMKHAKVHRDKVNHAPWLFDGQQFWTYEDPTSIGFKVEYAKTQGLGGVMIWELSGDSKDAVLLKSTYRALTAPDNASATSAANEAKGTKTTLQ